LAELLELRVLEPGVAQLGGQGAHAAAGQHADRAADDADDAADQGAPTGAPVSGLDELHLAVRLDVQDGRVPDLLGEGAAHGSSAARAAVEGGEAGSQDLTVLVSHG